MTSLFSDLFPDQFFDIDSSPARVHQAVFRLRETLRKNEVPVEIESTQFGFCVKKRDKNITLRKAIENGFTYRIDHRVEELKKKFQSAFFRSSEAQEFLNLSKSTLQRLLNEQIQSGNIVQLGQGKGSIYKFAA